MSSHPTFTHRGKPRQRRSGACVACHQRKIRCTGEQPACTECRKSGIDCIYRKPRYLTEAEAGQTAAAIEESKTRSFSRNGNAPPVVWTDRDGQVHERLRQACDRCRMKKNRCSGHVPECANCVEVGFPCVYATDKRGGPRASRPHEVGSSPAKRRKTASPVLPRTYRSTQSNPQSDGPQPKAPNDWTIAQQNRAPRGSTCVQCREKKRKCNGDSLPCEPCKVSGTQCLSQIAYAAAARHFNVTPTSRSRAPRVDRDDPSEQLRREINLAEPDQVAAKERPYPCQQCGKRFTRREHLKRHTQIHAGHKPFVCPQQGCRSSYYRADQLLRHSRSHGLTHVRDHVYSRVDRRNETRLCYGCDRPFGNATAFYDHFPCVATSASRNPNLEQETPASMEKRLTWCGACGRQFQDKCELQGHLPCDRAKTDFGDFVSQLEQAASTSVTPPGMQYG